MVHTLHRNLTLALSLNMIHFLPFGSENVGFKNHLCGRKLWNSLLNSPCHTSSILKCEHNQKLKKRHNGVVDCYQEKLSLEHWVIYSSDYDLLFMVMAQYRIKNRITLPLNMYKFSLVLCTLPADSAMEVICSSYQIPETRNTRYKFH